jgi:hypothetical protein
MLKLHPERQSSLIERLFQLPRLFALERRTAHNQI